MFLSVDGRVGWTEREGRQKMREHVGGDGLLVSWLQIMSLSDWRMGGCEPDLDRSGGFSYLGQSLADRQEPVASLFWEMSEP